MPQLLKVQYEKLNATFTNGEDAWADKNSMYPPGLWDSVQESNNNALAAGILLEPLYPEWDQETFTISICKLTSSAAEYRSTKTYDNNLCISAAAEAGWIYLGIITIDE
jgi:hypothetical protein